MIAYVADCEVCRWSSHPCATAHEARLHELRHLKADHPAVFEAILDEEAKRDHDLL